jgi:hypothetical protein
MVSRTGFAKGSHSLQAATQQSRELMRQIGVRRGERPRRTDSVPALLHFGSRHAGPGGRRPWDQIQGPFKRYLVGSVALCLILFECGLKVSIAQFGSVFWPASLATVGIAITAGIVGASVTWESHHRGVIC